MLRKNLVLASLILCLGMSIAFFVSETISLIHLVIITVGSLTMGVLNFLEYGDLINEEFTRHVKQAEEAYKRKQPSNALKAFDRALKLKPKAFEVHMGKAQSHRMLMQYEQALKDLELAALNEPTAFQPFFLSGMILLQMNKPDDAVKFFKKTEKANPEFVDTYFLLGQIQEKKGELREALRCYANYVEKNGPLKNDIADRVVELKKRLEIPEEEEPLPKKKEENPDFPNVIPCNRDSICNSDSCMDVTGETITENTKTQE